MGDISYKPLIDDMTFSYSRINSYADCPYMWKLKYIDGEKGEEKFYASYGSLVHEILAKYYNGEVTKSELPVEFLSSYSTGIKGLRPSGNIVDKYIHSAVDYFRRFKDFGLSPVLVESKVDFEVEGILMTGIIDFLGKDDDGKYYIVDHKSHQLEQRSKRLKPTKKDMELDAYLRQLYLYSKPIKEMYGEFPSELWFNCYRSGTIIKEKFDNKKYEEALKWAVETVDTIKNDTEFEAKYNYFYCRWLCEQSCNCDVFEEEMGR